MVQWERQRSSIQDVLVALIYSCPVPQFSTSETVMVVKLTFFIVLCVQEKKELGVITSTNDSLL